MSNLKKYDPENFRKSFLEILSKNKKLLQSLVDVANFYANMHPIRDDCPSGNGLCDQCYSEDTECDTNAEMAETLKKIWLAAYNKTQLGSDSEAEDENEDNEDKNN